jgi:chromate transporter
VILLELALWFCILSAFAVGGMGAVMPEMQRVVVEVQGWASGEEFLQLFAIGQAAPGPNVLVTSLIGWKVAGIPGALVSLLAFCGPAGVLTWFVADMWDRFKESPWRKIIQKAIGPLSVGMILAGGYVIATPGNVPDWRLWLIAGASAATLLAARLNPLWILAGGGVLGAVLL